MVRAQEIDYRYCGQNGIYYHNPSVQILSRFHFSPRNSTMKNFQRNLKDTEKHHASLGCKIFLVTSCNIMYVTCERTLDQTHIAEREKRSGVHESDSQLMVLSKCIAHTWNTIAREITAKRIIPKIVRNRINTA